LQYFRRKICGNIAVANLYTLEGPSTCYVLSDESGIPSFSTSKGFKNVRKI